MLERDAYDTVCQEHVEYYSLIKNCRMAMLVGLALVDVEYNELRTGGSFWLETAWIRANNDIHRSASRS